MKKIAILQSNYLPWKGVFDMINQVDEFVFCEDAQYTNQDWRNRNKVLMNNELRWITVPVYTKGKRFQKIYEAKINNGIDWQLQHYGTFKSNYSKAKYFKEYEWILEELYIKRKWEYISELNIYSTKLISDILGIKTKFSNSKDLSLEGVKDDKIIKICNSLNANYYLSGPAAKDYIVKEKFNKNAIELSYINYGYPEYEQIGGGFKSHNVTVLDLIFNCGKDAPYYIWGWREDIKKVGE